MGSSVLFQFITVTLVLSFLKYARVEALVFPLGYVLSYNGLADRRRRASEHRAELKRKDALIERLKTDLLSCQNQLDSAKKEADLLRNQVNSWKLVNNRLKGWVQALDPQARFFHLYSPEADLCKEIATLKEQKAKRVRFAEQEKIEAASNSVQHPSVEHKGCQTEKDGRDSMIAMQREEIKELMTLIDETSNATAVQLDSRDASIERAGKDIKNLEADLDDMTQKYVSASIRT